jgi:hypothetical protein
MRFFEILREYRRDITARNYGDRLIQTLGASDLRYLDIDMYNAASLINAVIHRPEKWGKKEYTMTVAKKPVTFGADNAPEVLQQLKPAIAAEILEEIERHDPTKTKEYTEWLTKVWIAGGGQVRFEDLNRNDLLQAYSIAKKKNILTPEDRDINRFKTLQQFEAMIKEYDVEELLSILYSSELGYGNSTVINDYASATIVIPRDLDASRRSAGGMGKGSAEWCTRSEYQFNRYTKEGPLYALIPKAPQHPGERYQLHFPTVQYMDEFDDPVSLIDLLTVRFPDLLPFFKEIMEQGGNEFTIFEDGKVLEPILRDFREIIKLLVKDLVNDEKDNDEEYAVSRGYVDAAGNPDMDKLYDDTDINAYLKYNRELEYFTTDVMSSYIPETVGELKEALISISKRVKYGGEIEYDNSLQPMRYLVDAISEICKQKAEKYRDHDYGPKLARWIDRDIGWYKRPGTNNWTVRYGKYHTRLFP